MPIPFQLTERLVGFSLNVAEKGGIVEVQCHDVIELKHPFLALFKKDGTYSAAFNDAWNQAERYLDFATRHRAYLLDNKKLRFENPRCLLILGHDLTEQNLKDIHSKEALNRHITVLTYDQLLTAAEHMLTLVKDAGERIPTGTTQSKLP